MKSAWLATAVVLLTAFVSDAMAAGFPGELLSRLRAVTGVDQPAAEAPKPASEAVEIARLIFQSQQACYAYERRAAIHELGDRYGCVDNPEILVAFVYALKDADETVRWKAADEIGDQVRRHPDCCAPEIVAALKATLEDCDPHVRRQARQALATCGHPVADDGSCCGSKGRDPKKKYEEKPKPGEQKVSGVFGRLRPIDIRSRFSSAWQQLRPLLVSESR